MSLIQDEFQIKKLNWSKKLCFYMEHLPQMLQCNYASAVQFISSSLLASGTKGGTIEIWDLNNNSIVQRLRGHSYSVWSLKLISNESLASGSGDESIKLWDLKNWSLIQTLNGHSNGVRC